MSKTDKTRPPRLKELEAEWGWRLRSRRYSAYVWCWQRGLDAWSKREVRRYWHSERQKTKNALRRGEEPEPSRHRHQVRWNMW